MCAKACNFIKKRNSNTGVSSEICEIFKSTYYEEYLQTTSVVSFSWLSLLQAGSLAGIYLLKISIRGSGISFVNFEHVSHLVLVFLLLTLNM